MITVFAILMVGLSLGIVGWPLFKGGGGRRLQVVEDSDVSETLAKKDATLLAISELESDYEMGNLSKHDYDELRTKYEEKALGLIKASDELLDSRGLARKEQIDVEIEAEVAQLRSSKRHATAGGGEKCPGCGSQIRSEDIFCAHCGTVLSMKCPGCAAQVTASDTFCRKCGARLSGAR